MNLIYVENINNIDVRDAYGVQFISADFGLYNDDDISIEDKQFLNEKYPDYLNKWKSCKWDGDCLIKDKTLYLVNRGHHLDLPTLESVEKSFLLCGITCVEKDIKKVVIHKSMIRDNLKEIDINPVIEYLNEIFANVYTEIYVIC